MSSKRDEIVAILDEDAIAERSLEESADRIIACMAEPTPAMVEAAVRVESGDYIDSMSKDFQDVYRRRARAALVAAGRAMVTP